jgi:hypothetical protein
MRYLFQWLARLIVGLTAVVICFALALLLAWQAFVIGVNHGTTAFLVFCVTGILIFLAVIAVHEFGHLVAGGRWDYPSSA